jgi:hypothetical protein
MGAPRAGGLKQPGSRPRLAQHLGQRIVPVLVLAFGALGIVLLPGQAEAGLSKATNLVPAPGLATPGSGLSYPCSSEAYNCDLDNYNPNNPPVPNPWWYTQYGPGQASSGPDGLHNCTMYAAFMLYQNGVTVEPGGTGGLGSASDWASEAVNMPGVTVNQTPVIGAIAQWNATSAAADGHLAYVQDVTSSGIVLSDDNYWPKSQGGNGGYTDEFTIANGSRYWPDNFIVFPTTQGAGSTALTPDQQAGLQYVNHIVQWTGDAGQAQPASWYVTMTEYPPLIVAVPMRHWIPTTAVYWCLVNQEHATPWPSALSSSILDNDIPNDGGQAGWAVCDTPSGGRGGGAPGNSGAGIAEQAGQYGAPTFADYDNAGGPGPRIAAGQYVSVACKVYDPTIASADPDGYWYQIATSPWDGDYYSPANVFMNGDPWEGPHTHNTDYSVPDCGSGSGAGGGGDTPTGPVASGTYLEQEGHYGASTFSDYGNASGPGLGISAGEYVDVACKVYDPSIPSVSPDGYWYLIASAPWNDDYYAAANTFMNGDPWNGPYSHNTDFSVPDCPSPANPPANPPSGSTYTEQEGHHGVNTFMDYDNASGEGPAIPPAADVQVACKVYDPTIASVNPDGYWYLIASSPWNGNYYAPANTFMNGDPWDGPYTHNTDFSVPDCGTAPTSPPPPATYAETTGSVANTWTNYTNAGGTEGPQIALNQTVQIACRLQGFTVADGNTWWYQIASSPWSYTYYVSADPFYNNGATSGPLAGTPFFDPNVPVCGSSAGSAPSYAETTGSVVQTWTDYADAGGSQGPDIGSNATIQVACKIQGFAVADGNTWWYQIAASPWNDAYYASADAFYNDGATSGPLAGTPFVDSGVPTC